MFDYQVSVKVIEWLGEISTLKEGWVGWFSARVWL